MKQPLNYQLLDQLFQAFTERHDKDAVMEIKGLDFTIKCYYDNGGRYKRETTTEQILKQYK